jgi:transcriptional regulator with XRE-family HTH domain
MIEVVSEKIIHFGEFIRWHRVRANKTTEALGREVGLTARRLIAIEAMAAPDVQHTTMAALATAFGFDPETFNEVWKTTPVPVTRRKAGPTTDEARRFSAACELAGTTPIEGMRRLRSWIVEQDPQTQTAALSFIAAHRQPVGFTDVVDHLQDPVEAVKKRIGHKAAQSASASAAKPPGSAATGESKRH